MCKKDHDKAYVSLEEQVAAHFHLPGKAKEYLERVSMRWGMDVEFFSQEVRFAGLSGSRVNVKLVWLAETSVLETVLPRGVGHRGAS